MTSLFLSDAELHELTGFRRKLRQIQWLKDHGYRFEVNGKGRARVLRSAVLGRLNHRPAPQKPEPDFAALTLHGKKKAA